MLNLTFESISYCFITIHPKTQCLNRNNLLLLASVRSARGRGWLEWWLQVSFLLLSPEKSNVFLISWKTYKTASGIV